MGAFTTDYESAHDEKRDRMEAAEHGSEPGLDRGFSQPVCGMRAKLASALI
jgi:hypothetical protein